MLKGSRGLAKRCCGASREDETVNGKSKNGRVPRLCIMVLSTEGKRGCASKRHGRSKKDVYTEDVGVSVRPKLLNNDHLQCPDLP